MGRTAGRRLSQRVRGGARGVQRAAGVVMPFGPPPPPPGIPVSGPSWYTVTSTPGPEAPWPLTEMPVTFFGMMTEVYKQELLAGFGEWFGVWSFASYTYSPITGVWTAHPNGPVGSDRRLAGSGVSGDSWIIFAGEKGISELQSAFILDLTTDTWSAGPNYPVRRTHIQSAVDPITGYVYGFGGMFSNVAQSEVYRWKEGDAGWTLRTALPEKKGRGAATYHAATQRIYIIGGVFNGVGDDATSLLEYDPATNSYGAGLSHASFQGQFMSLISIGNRLYYGLDDSDTGQWHSIDPSVGVSSIQTEISRPTTGHGYMARAIYDVAFTVGNGAHEAYAPADTSIPLPP